MIRIVFYVISVIVICVVMIVGFLLAKTIVKMSDFFDKKEKESKAYEEPLTTTLPPTLKEWINEEPLPSPPYKPLSTEEKIRNLENEIIRIWDYIMKIR